MMENGLTKDELNSIENAVNSMKRIGLFCDRCKRISVGDNLYLISNDHIQDGDWCVYTNGIDLEKSFIDTYIPLKYYPDTIIGAEHFLPFKIMTSTDDFCNKCQNVACCCDAFGNAPSEDDLEYDEPNIEIELCKYCNHFHDIDRDCDDFDNDEDY